jgi:hypothetical protein
LPAQISFTNFESKFLRTMLNAKGFNGCDNLGNK